jgi:hypothetical protein
MLSRRALNRATLARQLLLERKNVKPLAAIERLVGLQAQLPRPPFIGLWSRIDGFRRTDLIRLIERGDVVRATMMRGTLHLMSRKDYVKFRATLQPMLTLGAQSILRGRMSGIEVDRVVAEARPFFEEPHTFDEFRKYIGGGDERAIAYAVRMHLPLIQPPAEARWGYSASAVFTLFDDQLDSADLQALVLRYLAAFGPASINDMQTWSGLRNLRESFEALRRKLVVFTDERGKELFDLPKAPRPDEDSQAPVRFLPEYDNLLLGHADRTRIVPEEYRKRMFTANLAIPAAFLVDGYVAGTWKIERGKVMLEPFGRLSKKAKDDLAEEGEKLARFVEGD